MTRTPTLQREALADLTPAELAAVAGGTTDVVRTAFEKVEAVTDKFINWPTNEGCTPAYGG